MNNPWEVKAEWEDKCWGKVQHIFSTQAAAVSHLVVMPGFCCSMHMHVERANMFCVQSGMLQIEYHQPEWSSSSIHVMKAGDVFVVPSGVVHRFCVMEGGRVIEVYWPDKGGVCRFDDIIRDDKGGKWDG